MKGELWWEPAYKQIHQLSDELKNILLGRIIHSYFENHVYFDREDDSLERLKGWADAGVEGADELYRAVMNHGRINVFWRPAKEIIEKLNQGGGR